MDSYCFLYCNMIQEYFQGRQTGGGLGGLNPPWILEGGVERLSTPLILRKNFLGGVGSP